MAHLLGAGKKKPFDDIELKKAMVEEQKNDFIFDQRK